MMQRLLGPLAILVICLGITATARAQPPDVDPECVGFKSCDGWFTSDVTLRWTISGGAPITEGCQPIKIVADTPRTGMPRDCTARQTVDPFDTEMSRVTIFRDATPPGINELGADRAPDHAGWYTHPVSFVPKGEDLSSGLAGCNAPSYTGPDNAVASIVVTCRDVAGNSASRAFPLSYDATPPDPGPAAIKIGDRVVRLSWPAGSDASVTRTPGTDGRASSMIYEGTGTGFTDREVRNHRKYRYVLTLADDAGNTASRELSAKPQRKLLAPERSASLSAPPLLKWTPARHTQYYNVQLFRDGRKILSKWPRHASLQLKRKWRFHGKRYRLKPDEYRWYVWPGEGRRAANRYGDRIGRRSFTVLPG